jgi:hypothetical protein
MKKVHFLILALMLGSTAPTFLLSQLAEQKPFRLHLSVFAGVSPELTFNGQSNAAFGVRAGVLHEAGLYLGAVWSIHPFVMKGMNYRGETIGANPQVVCGELGWEFLLTPTSFLRPHVSVGRFGLDNSYKGYGGLTLLPAAESTTWGLGIMYGVHIARDISVGVEARAVMLAGAHITANITYRFY